MQLWVLLQPWIFEPSGLTCFGDWGVCILNLGIWSEPHIYPWLCLKLVTVEVQCIWSLAGPFSIANNLLVSGPVE